MKMSRGDWECGSWEGARAQGTLQPWVKIFIDEGKVMDGGHRSEACSQVRPEDFLFFFLMVF